MRDTRKLTLTFDNGPDPIATPLVLDELHRRGLPATFFAVGNRLEDAANRTLLARVAAAGHRVGNHTYSHPRPFGAIGDAKAVDEIVRTDALIGDLREPDRLFRPSAGGGKKQPGALNRGVVDHLIANRHTLVLWNVICEDWARPDGSWVPIAFDIMRKQPWSLIVLHDIAEGGMAHLGTFLDQVAAAGIEVVADFPPEEVPIRNGELVLPVDHLI
ncbi:MAG: polysaccharide deacetylase family protein [Hyphomicrobiaceae bacterium]|nr:polysaccharide deacetylase family protein [Hyphomicrobiaceae bacterium]